MTTSTIEPPAQGHPARRLALDPYVMRVRTWCLENARIGNSRPVSLRLGNESLTIEPPEFALILRAARADEELHDADDDLAIESIGLLTKSHEDLANLRASSSPNSRDVFALQAELMLDSALGTALIAETDAQIRDAVVGGRTEQAETLGKLRQRLHKTVSAVCVSISESERERARDLAGCLTERPLSPTAIEDQELETAGIEIAEELEAEAAPVAAASVGSRPITAPLAIGLALAVAAWLGLFVLPLLWQPRLDHLALGDFDRSGVLLGVEAHPPSLFVEVDRDAWRALDDGAKLGVVEEIARVLSKSGYEGAFVETEDGLPVAQWLRQRGPSLIAEPSEP